MYQVYGDRQSGNCYKVQLCLELLDLEYRWLDIDILAGETKTQEFLAISPNGKIPLLKLDKDQGYLSESNAILNYLADGSYLLPSDTLARAKVLQWQFFEQYSHEPYIAVARFINKYQGLPQERLAEYEAKQAGGHKALALMEQCLANNAFLIGEQFSIADISLFAYTHVADEGGFDLAAYPAVQAWIKRVQALAGFSPMHSES